MHLPNQEAINGRGVHGFGSPEVTQSLSFGLGLSDSNLLFEIALRFEFISRDVCAPLRIYYLGFKSDSPDLKLKKYVTSLDLNSVFIGSSLVSFEPN